MFCCIHIRVANDNLDAVRIQGADTSKNEIRSGVDERGSGKV